MIRPRYSLTRSIAMSFLFMMGLLRTTIGVIGLILPLKLAEAQDWPIIDKNDDALITTYVHLFSATLIQVGVWTLMAAWNTRDFYTTDWMSMRLLFVEMIVDSIALKIALFMGGEHRTTNIVWASIFLTLFTFMFVCTWRNARRHRFEPLLG